MLPSFCKDVAKVLRAPLIEQRGSKVRDWTNAEEHTLSECSLQIVETLNKSGARESTYTSLKLYCQPKADIQKGDKVIVDDVAYMVEGEPFNWVSPRGKVSHVEVKLVRWNG